MNSSVEIPVLISLAAVWISIRWIGDRLIFESPLGMIFGRLATGLGIGLAAGFAVSGGVSEINLSILSQSMGASNDTIRSSGYSTFAAAIFGGIFGALTGIGLGLWHGISDYRQYSRKVERLDVKNEAVPFQKIADDNVSQTDNLHRLGKTDPNVPAWLAALLLFGAAIYFLTLGIQTDPLNVFGQECIRAYSTTQRVGGICLRSEWLALGAVLLVLSILLGFRRNAART